MTPSGSTKDKKRRQRNENALKKGRKRIQSTKRMMCRTDTCNGGETHGGFVLIMDHTCAAPEGRRRVSRAARKAAEEARCEDWVGETRGEMEKERETERRGKTKASLHLILHVSTNQQHQQQSLQLQQMHRDWCFVAQ